MYYYWLEYNKYLFIPEGQYTSYPAVYKVIKNSSIFISQHIHASISINDIMHIILKWAILYNEYFYF